MNTNQTSVIWTVIIASLILLIGGIFMYASIPTANEVASQIQVPSASDIASQIVIPQAPTATPESATVIDSGSASRLCELTEGCEYWSGNLGELNNINTDRAERDFEKQLSALVGIDRDYLVYDYTYKDAIIRAYTDEDRDEDNWDCRVFLKINYYDEDDPEDDSVIYVVVKSVLDEGEYDSLSVEKVSRNFKFN